MSTLYSLSKIDKNLHNFPGQPIVSGCNSLTEKISQVIDSYLRPHVYSLNFFVKDTIEFLRMIGDITLPPGAWLMTIDVETIYSSIAHALGLHAVAQFLKVCVRNQRALNDFMLQALEFVLRNTFTFDNHIFSQTQGVAMGTPCAPNYLYLGWWEQQLFADESLPMYLCHASAWHRYINDVFIVT